MAPPIITVEHAITYVAVPYSHKSRDVRLDRFRESCEFSAWLIAQGRVVISTISMHHPIAELGGLFTTFAFWRDNDLALLQVCSDVAVLTLDGWELSVGVRAEVAYAKACGKSVTHYGKSKPGEYRVV